MSPQLYAGDPASAFAAVGDALGTAEGSGRPLAALTIVFGNGEVRTAGPQDEPVYNELGAIGFSTASARAKVTLGVVGYDVDPPDALEEPTASGAAPPDIRAQRLYVWLETQTRVPRFTDGDGGGGGGGFFGGLVATVTAGACRAFAGENCGGEEARRAVQFVVSLLHGATLAATPDGKLTLQIRCPAGFGDVTGSIEIKSVPRLGERQSTLGEVASFDCGKPTTPVTVELSDAAQQELERDGHVAVEITVLARSPGHFDGDVVDLTLELRRS